MTKTLIHRGPDDGGVWLDGDEGIALGHRRLSIIDLSSAGHQPMTSMSGRYVLVFNGEIYNYLQIRKELEVSDFPPAWRGHSDTEILLAAFDQWGIEVTLRKCAGMFGVALWDRRERTLTIARDRMGEKPLYYGWQGDVFLFGSELKALRAHPSFHADIDRNVLAMYMSRGYIEAPHSIYQDIFKLPPGAYLQLSTRSRPGILPEICTYWSLSDVARQGLAQPFTGSDEDAIDELDARLKDAIALQCVSDVPLGAFLSGGIDSTSVVAFMQQGTSQPVRTFTIGFHEASHNEAEHAKAVAQYLGTDHTELYVTSREAMDVIPRLPLIFDEPFGDCSAIPTFLVSQLARQHVTVSLSGDGGDELFGGYARYRRTSDIWGAVSRIPGFTRNAMAYGLSAFAQLADASEIGQKARRLALYLPSKNIDDCYQKYITQRQDIHNLVLDSGKLVPMTVPPNFMKSSSNSYAAMMYRDAMGYLPGDILAKVDRAAMSIGLETRVPMLSPDIVEFAWRLPMHMKVRRHEGKWILKQLLRKYLPDAIVNRPKMGFGVPVGRWIRGPLRDWAENLLSSERLQQQGYLNPQLVRKEWSRHLSGSSAGGDHIWQLLMFQAWLTTVAPHRCSDGEVIWPGSGEAQ